MKMKEDQKKIIKRIVIAVVLAFGIPLAIFWPKLQHFAFIFGGVRYTKRMRVRLLCEMDHQVLLEACRELSGRAQRGDLKPGTYWLRGSQRLPAVSRFPQPILDLEPSYVYIDENNSGRVMLEMHGGFVYFGVQAYTEDYEKPHVGFEYGDRELIPGLWYYDDGYHDDPEYDKKIEALIQKGKMKRPGKRA